MKFDILMPGTNRAPYFCAFAHHLDTQGYRTILEVIDELDFQTVTVSDHLGMPLHEVPRLGGHWDEALTVMAFVAGATRRVRIDASVIIAPLHHPLRLAKAIATMDVLSGGRVNLSVGVGHAVREFEVIGVPFRERGVIADEVLDALEAIWTKDVPKFSGKYFQIDGLVLDPRPLQDPRPPIYVGGNSKPALRRAARFEGWQPSPIDFGPSDIPPLLDYLRSQPAFNGKEGTFDVNWVPKPSQTDLPRGFIGADSASLTRLKDELVERYVETFPSLGITRTCVQAPQSIADLEEYLDYLRWFASDVIAEVRAARASPAPAGI